MSETGVAIQGPVNWSKHSVAETRRATSTWIAVTSGFFYLIFKATDMPIMKTYNYVGQVSILNAQVMGTLRAKSLNGAQIEAARLIRQHIRKHLGVSITDSDITSLEIQLES